MYFMKLTWRIEEAVRDYALKRSEVVSLIRIKHLTFFFYISLIPCVKQE